MGYGKIFEEEYEAIVSDRLKHPTQDDILDPSYAQYLGRFEARSVHSGYFSVDKKGNAVESKAEKEGGARGRYRHQRRRREACL